MNNDQVLREHLAWFLEKGHAHVPAKEALANFPAAFRGEKPQNLPHTAWQLLEHLRIVQWDILEFSRSPQHISPPFPRGYWPESPSPENNAQWERSVENFLKDLQEMINLVKNPATDLFAPIPHGEGQTILREALLVGDHNAYHVGQLLLLRKALNIWPAS